MQITSFVSLALLSTLGFTEASPVRRSGNPLTWQVSKFDTGCSPGGCAYSFNIVGSASQNTPGFNTTCQGIESEGEYQLCDDKHIRTIVSSSSETSPTWNVKVLHAWQRGGNAEFYALGAANVTSTTKNFTIPVTDVYGVA